MVAMSQFSDVDAAPDVERLITYLDRTDRGLSPMKRYMATAAALHVPGGVVLDIGCGMGGDLGRLQSEGLSAVGLDASMSMLTAARRRFGRDAPLLQGDAARLPFATASVDGCRIERVLQHVMSPMAVVNEIARVVRPGGFVGAFDTDFSRYTAETEDESLVGLPGSVVRARHPRVGGELASLLSDAGFAVGNVVTEQSRASSFDRLPTDVRASIASAVADGTLEAAAGERWIAEQELRSATGRFRAMWVKVLVTAIRI